MQFSFLQWSLSDYIRRVVYATKRRGKTTSIKNFGQLDDRFYRGGQPRKHQYVQLAALGISTVINLRDDPKPNERPGVQAAGMRYVHIPMSDTDYPSSETVDLFLNSINDPATRKFFVHCAGGRHRTGAMGAVYRRVSHDWDYECAYGEMKTYGFYTRWGHGPLKEFVEDFYGVSAAGGVIHGQR